MRIIITGGAGFIGSHLSEKLLLSGQDVTVIDNLSTGRLKNLDDCFKNKNFKFFDSDLLNHSSSMEPINRLFHLAWASSSRNARKTEYEKDLVMLRKALELARSSDAESFIFPSSSTVYGETDLIPTPENHNLNPISKYGKCKLECENIIKDYCDAHGIGYIIFRLANIVGKRMNKGVIYDFINKLQKNPNELEILGNGKQKKSYLLVSDCVDAILLVTKKLAGKHHKEIFNVGSEDGITVSEIAKAVCEAMGLKDVEFVFDNKWDGRGWPGDVKISQLSVEKIKKLGWRPSHSSAESVRIAANETIKLNGSLQTD